MNNRLNLTSSFRLRNFSVRWIALLLGVATLAVYWPVVHNGFVNFDDDVYVTANGHVQQRLSLENLCWALGTAVNSNWHPMTMLSYMLDYQIYGLNPFGYHLTNALLHALNTVLVFLLFYRLTNGMWLAAWVAAAFSWHPLRVESVAWVAERKDMLSACFGLGALLSYMRYAAAQEKRAEPDTRHGTSPFYLNVNYWLAFLWLSLGLMSKPMLVTWPFVFLLLDYWPLARFKRSRILILLLEKIPFLLLAVLVSVVTFVVQKRAGAVRPLEMIPFGMRCENAIISYGRYLLKMIWPSDLAVFYPYNRLWSPGVILLTTLLLAGITTLVWVKRSRFPFFLVGWLWFLGTLVPVIGLVQVGIQALADRYTYLPSLGILLMVSLVAHELWDYRRWHLVAFAIAGTMILATCAVLTRSQIGYWRDGESLFRHTLAVTAESDVVRNNLGVALLQQDRTKEALEQFQATLRLNPACVEAHENLGDIYRKQAKFPAAKHEFEQALRFNPNNAAAHAGLADVLAATGEAKLATSEFQTALGLDPDLAPAHYNFAGLLAKQGQIDAAINEYQQAIHAKRDFAEAYNNLGNLLAQKNQTDAAVGPLQKAIQLKPHYVEALNNLGNCYMQQGAAAAAIEQFQLAIRSNPNYTNAHFNLANALVNKGDTSAAVHEYREVLRLDPKDYETHYKLGNLLAKVGQPDVAISEFQQTIDLKPDSFAAHNNLGIVLVATGQADLAIGQFQMAIGITPTNAEAHYNLGNAFFKKGAMDQAIAEYQAVQQLSSNFPPSYYYLGLALVKKGKTEEAVRQLQTAIRLQPGFAAAHEKLGSLLLEEGHIDEAIQQFQEALRLKPGYAEAQADLARALAIKK